MTHPTGAYAAASRLALTLDLERVLHSLVDHLPGEPPAIIAWGPGELATAIAERLTSPTPGCLACTGWTNDHGQSPVHNAGCPRDCVAREGCTGDYHRAGCPTAASGEEVQP